MCGAHGIMSVSERKEIRKRRLAAVNISERIRSHRKEAGLTQEQVAAYLGVSAPAVNKWEKGNTFPDITLLPALARLLKIDMNELFSFREELTELEIGQFANEIAETAMRGDFDAAFETAAAKIQEYPRCDSLIYMVATTLDGVLVLSDVPDERRETYKKTVFDWLERVSGSADEKIRCSVVYLLAAKYLQMEDYEKAGFFLGQIPDVQTDKTLLQTRLLLHEKDEAAAAVFLEGNLLQTAGRMQNYLFLLLEIEEQGGNHREAEAIAEISVRMCSLFGLWPYGAVVPRLLIALFRKDEKQSVRLIEEALEESQKPWDMRTSPLYYRHPQQPSQRLGRHFAKSFISEIRNEEEYEFLRGNTELENILKKYEESLEN